MDRRRPSFEDLKPTDLYYHRWSRVRAWRVLALVAWVAFLPALGGVMLLSRHLFPGSPGLVSLGLLSAGAILVRMIGALVRVKCPRCRLPFYSAGFFDRWPFKKWCVNCGLPEYAPHDHFDDEPCE